MTMLIGKLEPFSGDAYQSSPNLKIWKIELRKKTLFMDYREVVCDTYIWTEIDLDWFPRMTTLIGKLEPFSGYTYQSSPNLKIWKI